MKADLSRKILDLEDNWDSYGAKKIDENLYNEIVKLYNNLLETEKDIYIPRVIPTVRGGVQLEWYVEDEVLEIEIIESGKYLIYYKNSNEEVELEMEIRT